MTKELLAYQSDSVCRQKINEGRMEYIDIHLSHVAQHAWSGFFGKLDVAVIEVAGVTEDGKLIPSSSIGNIANAVLAGLNDGPFKNLTSYTEVLQDGMLGWASSP
ncbi:MULTISPECIES: hypothetical protein [Marinobacter]|uniref:Acetyl-CoA hydrolase/transferase N-terminal domain-containing protein n=1 Tax=Marinobacter metalliresistant TaxID=2961995 RepID=A0ABZ2W6H8_9GAMM|nr:hypothetical protein [Marinobacter sp. Arc7-DN-1]